MEAKNVEMFLLTNSKYFPSESMMVVKEKLEKLPEDKAVLLHSLQFKDPVMLLIISILIGGLGIDRFILGQTGLGVAKLLTCGGLGIWTIIDWFLIMGETRNVNLQKLNQVGQQIVDTVSKIQVRRFYIILTLLVIAGWGLILADRFILHGFFLEGRTLCVIKNLTGYPCPSCGIRGGIGYLTRLEFGRAIMQNPLSLIVAAGGLAVPVWMVWDMIQRDNSLYRFNKRTGNWLRKNPLIILILILLVLVNWIWNFYKF